VSAASPLRDRERNDVVTGCAKQIGGEDQHRLGTARTVRPVVADDQDPHDQVA
jgi:hypothetical protein